MSLCLVCSSAFVLLDAFVIPKAQQQVAVQSTAAAGVSAQSTKTQTAALESGETTASSQAAVTENSYKDDKISISISTQRVDDSDVYIADVQLADASLLKTALAQNIFGRNIKATTSEMAQQHDAILAINGDYYGFRDSGYVVRNGTVYRSTARSSDSDDALVIDTSGNFTVIDESTTSLDSIQNAWQVLSFGPALVENGQSVVSQGEEVSTRSRTTLNPRTAIGMISPLHYIVIVVDGRTSQSAGITLDSLADLFVQQGCSVAYNLDGGGSSAMVFNGQLVNNPTSGGSNIHEREVSDIVYFGYQG